MQSCNIVFVPIALSAHLNAGALNQPLFARFASVPNVDPTFLMLLLANVGATITPWMIFFQQSAVTDKGLTKSDLPHARLDTAIGATVAAAVAIATIFLGSVLASQRAHPSVMHTSADFANALLPYIGRHMATLFALGMIEAGLAAAVTISASTGYAAGEVLGLGKSLNRSFGEAAPFYAVVFASLFVAAGIVLIPHAPLLLLALIANVVATIFMAPALAFLILLANDHAIMGPLANGRVANAAGAAVMIAVSALGLAYGIFLLFPKLLPA